MSKKSDETRAFEPVDDKSRGFRSERSREKLVIAIFLVIILILSILATLIVAKIVDRLNTTTTQPPQSNFTQKITEPNDCKIGDLLLINNSYSASFPSDLSNMVSIYDYQRDQSNLASTKIGGKMTYSLSADTIYLRSDALEAFNAMVLDYCKTIDITSASSDSASDLEIAWGGYGAGNTGEYLTDIRDYGKDFYDHCLGTSLTLKYNSDHTRITEEKLKKDFAWICENAHKYGFIIRYPNSCSEHTGLDGKTRVHLRYVGVAHATYMYENSICLDEYLDLLRSTYTYGYPLTVQAGDKSYEIYYAKVIADPTYIYIPRDAVYTVSGDNINGLIITVEK